MGLKVNGGFDETAHDLERLLLKAIALKAGCNEGIIMWPNRSQMIPKWIIAKSSAGQSAHSPTVEHFIREQPFGDLAGAFRLGDSGPERVPGIGGENRSLTIVLLQCERVVAVVDPKIAIETLAQAIGLLFQCRCPLFLAHTTEKRRHLDLRLIDVALHLDQCDWGLG